MIFVTNGLILYSYRLQKVLSTRAFLQICCDRLLVLFLLALNFLKNRRNNLNKQIRLHLPGHLTCKNQKAERLPHWQTYICGEVAGKFSIHARVTGLHPLFRLSADNETPSHIFRENLLFVNVQT